MSDVMLEVDLCIRMMIVSFASIPCSLSGTTISWSTFLIPTLAALLHTDAGDAARPARSEGMVEGLRLEWLQSCRDLRDHLK